MSFSHPRLMEIERYTAWRLGCSAEMLTTPGFAVLVARTDIHPWLNNPYAATHPDVVDFFRYGERTLLRVPSNPTSAVERALHVLSPLAHPQPDDLLSVPELTVTAYPVDPYFYLERSAFIPVDTTGVRILTADDRPAMEELHAHVEENRRWYVETDHPIVFGRFVDGTLVAVASHFLFDDYRIAAPGVLTHADWRQQGHGTAVVSATVQWALERDWIVEWCTNERNFGSMGIARRLGFSRFADELEFRVTDDPPQ